MFVSQLLRLNRPRQAAEAVMLDAWDSVEELLHKDTSRGWLDIQSFFLQVARK